MLARNEVLQERYRIVRQLGRGGMGAVYEAIDERFGEAVALKEIVTETLSSDSQKELFVRAFEREARVLAKARHEAVPYVRDYFSEFGRQFLVMELIEGADLAEMLERRQSPFPLEDVLNWLDQLLDALDYLHTLQPPLIHRDIKPQNLKLTSRGKIKLLDFGISKTVDAANTVTNQTFVGATINYSPIEQILPAITQTFREFIILKHERKAQYVLSQNTDARCDIYAAGATIYHLVTGRPPIDAAKRSLEMWEGGHDPLLNPTELNPVIPPAISAFLLKSLEVDRERRYPSAVEMRKILHAVVNEEIRRKKEADAAAVRLAAEQERLRSAAAAERESSPLAPPPIPLPSTPPPPPATAHSETEPLVAGDEFAETIRDISAHIQHLPTEQFQMPAVVSPPAAASSSTPMTEQPAPSAFDAPLPHSSSSASVKRPDTDPTLKPASDTHPTGGISEFELTAVSHLAEILGQNEEEAAAAARKNESDSQPKSSGSGRLSAVSEAPATISNAATPAATARASRKNPFPLWILPIAAVGILAACGLLIGGLVWLNTPGEPDTPPRPENVLHPTPAPTAAFEAAPAQTPTPVPPTPDLTTPTPAASPVSTPNEQPSADSTESGQSKPQTVSPTGAKTPVPTTPKTVNTKTTPTPPGRRAPSQRTTKPKTPDPNCIYTNSC